MNARARLFAWIAAVLLAAASPAAAVDGVIEISQARAVAGGLNGDTVGDPPGFPVVITAPGSYRLTENLLVTNPSGGIQVLASNVHIDFNGFTLVGNNNGPGDGVDASGQTIRYVSVRNGGIRDFDGACVRMQDRGRVEDMTLHDCTDSGVTMEEEGVIKGNRIFDNAGPGGIFAAENTAVEGNQLANNAGG